MNSVSPEELINRTNIADSDPGLLPQNTISSGGLTLIPALFAGIITSLTYLNSKTPSWHAVLLPHLNRTSANRNRTSANRNATGAFT